MTPQLVYYPHPALTTPCQEVTEFSKLAPLISNAFQVMDAAKPDKGMAIAANQMGITQAWFVMRTRKGEELVCVNPRFEPGEGATSACVNEGCLSSPGVWEMVETRIDRVILHYQDEEGQRFSREFEGIEAVCVQHECDHLDGIFWTERLPRPARRRVLKQMGLK